jgi:hypothetical protein
MPLTALRFEVESIDVQPRNIVESRRYVCVCVCISSCLTVCTYGVYGMGYACTAAYLHCIAEGIAQMREWHRFTQHMAWDVKSTLECQVGVAYRCEVHSSSLRMQICAETLSESRSGA